MDHRPTESRHARSAGLHRQETSAMLAHLLDAQADAVIAVRPALGGIARAAEAGATALRAGGRMAYAGAGSSGLMALADCLELAGTFGIPPDRTPMLFAGGTAALLHMTGDVEDDPRIADADLDRVRLGSGDVVICVSASGSTPYTLRVAEGARGAGAVVVGMASVPGSALLAASDVAVLLETGAEMVAGSTRLGAATAQKVALNLLSVAVGVGLGHVYEGFMVNLVADNAKLAARAAGIVRQIAGCDTATAHAALATAGGRVKPAILVALGLTLDEAAVALEASAGHLGPVLARITT